MNGKVEVLVNFKVRYRRMGKGKRLRRVKWG